MGVINRIVNSLVALALLVLAVAQAREGGLTLTVALATLGGIFLAVSAVWPGRGIG